MHTPSFFILITILIFGCLPLQAQEDLDPISLEIIKLDEQYQLITDAGRLALYAPVRIRNLWTGEVTESSTNGAGQVQQIINAAPGTPFSIYLLDPTQTQYLYGTILYAPFDALPQTDYLDQFKLTQQWADATISATILGRIPTRAKESSYALEQLTLDTELTGLPTTFLQDAEWAFQLDIYALSDENNNLQPILDYAYGWSNNLDESGLALSSNAPIFKSLFIKAINVQTSLDKIRFRIQAASDTELPDGYYALAFQPYLRAQGGDWQAWSESPYFQTPTTSLNDENKTHPHPFLPYLLSVGSLDPLHIPVSILHELSQPQRGLLPQQDLHQFGLINGTSFSPDTLIMPPGSHSLSPYLPFLLPNRPDPDLPPLLTLDLTKSAVRGSITTPDGQIIGIPRSRLSTLFLNLTAGQWGAHVPQHLAQLIRNNTLGQAFTFDQYGDYKINLYLQLQDVWGNRFEGGGTYSVLIAEPLIIQPWMPVGVPLLSGDQWIANAQTYPPTADIQMHLTIFADDGTTHHFEPLSGDVLDLSDLSGKYLATYHARWQAENGLLYAANLSSVGGILPDQIDAFIVHGKRGVQSSGQQRLARFDTLNYPDDNPYATSNPFLPYFAGDGVWLSATDQSALIPQLSLQLSHLERRNEFIDALSQDFLWDEIDIADLSTAGAQVEAWLTIANPFNTYRQLAFTGAQQAQTIPFAAGPNPENESNLSPLLSRGDFAIIYGYVLADNGQSPISGGYSSFLIADNRAGARVQPALNQINASPLITRDKVQRLAFVLPAGNLLTQSFTLGESPFIGGQLFPPIAGQITLNLLSPDQTTTTITAESNPFGFFSIQLPDLDQAGLWQLGLTANWADLASASFLGLEDGRFDLVVLPADPIQLTTNQDDLWGFDMAGLPVSIILDVPESWQNVSLNFTLATPLQKLDQGQVAVTGTTARYVYNDALYADDDTFPKTIRLSLIGEVEGVPHIASRVFQVIDGYFYDLSPYQP